jgi:hypothetical protein
MKKMILVSLVCLTCAYAFGGDIIYIVKQTLDERVSVLERKVALMEAYFNSQGINLEQVYCNRIRIVQDGPVACKTDSYNPRTQMRYLVTLKDHSKMIVVTFERKQERYTDFMAGTKTKDYYVLHLENGQRINKLTKDVDDITVLQNSNTN